MKQFLTVNVYFTQLKGAQPAIAPLEIHNSRSRPTTYKRLDLDWMNTIRSAFDFRVYERVETPDRER